MKINSQIYKKAANLIKVRNVHLPQYHNGACNAIYRASSKSNYMLYNNLFAKYFRPYKNSTWWFGDILNDNNILVRELALDFMAEIAKDLK